MINPDDIIRDYGADSMRMYEMFMGPLEVSKPWSTDGLTGIFRFLNKVWNVAQKSLSNDEPDDNMIKLLHKTIKKVSLDTDQLQFNTAIAQMMIFINEISKLNHCYRKLWEAFVLLISPYAPHLGEEMWEPLGHRQTLAFESWPQWIEALTKDDEIEIVAQINGKVRAKLQVFAAIEKDEMETAVLALPRIQELIAKKKVVKVIVVPGKLVNIVV